MLLLRDHCQTVLPGWSTQRTKSSVSYSFLFKRLQSTNYSEVSCCWKSRVQSRLHHKVYQGFQAYRVYLQTAWFGRLLNTRPSKVTLEPKDLINVEQQMVGGLKLEIKYTSATNFCKKKGGAYIWRGQNFEWVWYYETLIAQFTFLSGGSREVFVVAMETLPVQFYSPLTVGHVHANSARKVKIY